MAVSTSALTGSVATQQLVQQSPRAATSPKLKSFLSVRVVIFSLTLACPFALLGLLSLV